MRGISCDKAKLTFMGLEHDRRWMVTDAFGTFKSQRDLPGLALIQPEISESHLILNHKVQGSIHIPIDKHGDSVNVTIWEDTCAAIDLGDEIASWLQKVLKADTSYPLRLVRFDTDNRREVDPSYLNGEDAHTAFADGFPYLITSFESLHNLNDHLIASGSEAVPMNRFRSNIIISGVRSFQEDQSHRLYHENGLYELGIRKPCKRCVIITRDQSTGKVVEPGEPLRSLVQVKGKSDRSGAFFGQNATLINGENQMIRVGDRIFLE